MEDRPEDGNHEPRRSVLADLYRLGTTHRWQIVHLSRQQTVAEHSFFVALMYMRFAELCSLRSDDITEGLQYALLHDADEAWSGDIPGPLKKFLRFDAPVPISQMLGSWFRYIQKDRLPDLVKTLVKLADIVEAVKFLTKFGEGTHARAVLEKYDHQVSSQLAKVQRELIPYHGWDVHNDRSTHIMLILDDEIAGIIDGPETYLDDYLPK